MILGFRSHPALRLTSQRAPVTARETTVPNMMPAKLKLVILLRSDGGVHLDRITMTAGKVTPSPRPVNWVSIRGALSDPMCYMYRVGLNLG